MNPNAVRVVDEYLAALTRILVVANEAAGPGGVLGLIARVDDGALPATGTLPNGVSYYKHGAGIELTGADGLPVDFDVPWIDFDVPPADFDDLPSSSCRFDSWRIRKFAEPNDRDRAPLESDIDEVLRALAAEGRLRPVESEFYELNDSLTRPVAAPPAQLESLSSELAPDRLMSTHERRRAIREMAREPSKRMEAAQAEVGRMRREALNYEREGLLEQAAEARTKVALFQAERERFAAEARRFCWQADAIACPGFDSDPDDPDMCMECASSRCRDCGDHGPEVAPFDGVPLCRDCASERFRDEPDLPLGIDPEAFFGAISGGRQVGMERTTAFRAALPPYLGFADLDESSVRSVDGVERAIYASQGEEIYRVTFDAAKEGSPSAWWIGTQPSGIAAGAAQFKEAARMLAQLATGSAGGAAGDRFDETFGRRLAARSRGGIFVGPIPGAPSLMVLPDLMFATIVATLAPGATLGALGIAPRGGVVVKPNDMGERTGSTIQITHPDGRVVGGPVIFEEFTVGAADVPWALDQLVLTSRRELLLIQPVVIVPAPAGVWAELPVDLGRGISARLIGGGFDFAALHESAEEARRIMGRAE